MELVSVPAMLGAAVQQLQGAAFRERLVNEVSLFLGPQHFRAVKQETIFALVLKMVGIPISVEKEESSVRSRAVPEKLFAFLLSVFHSGIRQDVEDHCFVVEAAQLERFLLVGSDEHFAEAQGLLARVDYQVCISGVGKTASISHLRLK